MIIALRCGNVAGVIPQLLTTGRDSHWKTNPNEISSLAPVESAVRETIHEDNPVGYAGCGELLQYSLLSCKKQDKGV